MFNTTVYPKVWQRDIGPGTLFGGPNRITFPDVATFTMIINDGDVVACIMLNADTEAVLSLDPHSSISFNSHDLHLTSVDFENTAAKPYQVQVIAGLARG